MEFKSAIELYERLTPALKSKVAELNREGYNYLTIEDVWNFLKEKKWQNSSNLALNEMVSDIFSSDGAIIDDYFKHKLRRSNRHLYFEDKMED